MWKPTRWVGAAVLVLAAFVVAHVIRTVTGGVPINWMADFDVYRGGGAAVREGLPLYQIRIPIDYWLANGTQVHLPFTYTPFAAIVFTPLSLLTTGAAHAFWFGLNLLALGAVIWLSLGLMRVPGGRLRLGLTLGGVLAAFVLDPIWENALDGQINVLLMLLVLLDFAPWMPRRLRGMAIGIAAGIKLTPLIFVGYLLCVGRWRDALRAALTFVAAIGLSFLLIPDAARQAFTGGYLFDVNRFLVGPPIGVNFSLTGLLARLSGHWANPWWTVPICGLLGIAGILLGAWVTRRGHQLLGVVVVAFTATTVSPLTWYYHLVWIVPALIWLLCATWRSGRSLLPRVLALAATLWFEVPLFAYAQEPQGRPPYFQFTPVGDLIATVTSPIIPVGLALVLLPVWAARLKTGEPCSSARPHRRSGPLDRSASESGRPRLSGRR